MKKKTSFLSNKDRDTERETEGQKKRKAAERWHIGRETGTGNRLRTRDKEAEG